MYGRTTSANDQESRLEWLQRMLVETGSVTVSQAVSALNVSRMTIHRDLDVLHAQGVLSKVRGGATAWTARPSLSEEEAIAREDDARHQKAAIAKAAASLVARGDVIMCDESTTVLGVIERLKSNDMITVITNFSLAMELAIAKPGIRLIVIGGDYQPRFRAMVGTLALSALSDLRANVALVSCVAVKGGHVYHQDQEIVSLKRAMLNQATTRVLLADSSKFGSTALYRICKTSEFDHIVVDDGISAGDLAELQETGASIHVARTGTIAETSERN